MDRTMKVAFMGKGANVVDEKEEIAWLEESAQVADGLAADVREGRLESVTAVRVAVRNAMARSSAAHGLRGQMMIVPVGYGGK